MDHADDQPRTTRKDLQGRQLEIVLGPNTATLDARVVGARIDGIDLRLIVR